MKKIKKKKRGKRKEMRKKGKEVITDIPEEAQVEDKEKKRQRKVKIKDKSCLHIRGGGKNKIK